MEKLRCLLIVCLGIIMLFSLATCNLSATTKTIIEANTAWEATVNQASYTP
jgi:hypothetical protein